MFASALIPALALLAPVFAQDNSANNGSASAVQIEGLEANFQQAQLVPQLISEFSPDAILSVAFGGSAVSPGDKLEQSAVGTAPEISVTPEAGETIEGSTFTLIMVDANTVGTDESTEAQTRHWLVNGVTINNGSSAPYALTFDSATTITDYAGPGPAEGSGSHRYVIALYEQPSSFAAPANLSQAGTALGTMFLSSYVSESGLGDLVSANYFQVEVGTASATVASTTAVDSTTLEGYGSTTVASATSGANSQTSSGTGVSATGSSSPSGSSAASQAGSAASAASSAATTGGSGSSAAGRTDVAWTAIVGGLGVVGAVVGAAF